MIPIIEQIEQTIVKREQELQELRQQLVEAIEDSLPLHHKIALKLFHMKAKSMSQIQSETWEYEINDNVHDWSGDAHQYWLVRADRLINYCKQHNLDPFVAIEIYTMIDKI